MEGIGLISLLAAASFAGAGVVRLYPALIEQGFVRQQETKRFRQIWHG